MPDDEPVRQGQSLYEEDKSEAESSRDAQVLEADQNFGREAEASAEPDSASLNQNSPSPSGKYSLFIEKFDLKREVHPKSSGLLCCFRKSLSKLFKLKAS